MSATTAVRLPTTGTASDQSAGRLAWMDNLRVVVIAGVIVTHVATAYALDVDWYYEERTSNAVTQAVVAAAILPAALFAMAALFLVAGFLSHRSLARKGARLFARQRLLHLGVPLLAYMFLLGPVTSVLGQWAQDGDHVRLRGRSRPSVAGSTRSPTGWAGRAGGPALLVEPVSWCSLRSSR
jgi:peptidoglycan/LPS O-acetylase OafA/YrhL